MFNLHRPYPEPLCLLGQECLDGVHAAAGRGELPDLLVRQVPAVRGRVRVRQLLQALQHRLTVGMRNRL